MAKKDSKNKTHKLSDLCRPTERQLDFIRAMDSHKYTLYGGAKGGGKIVADNGYVLTPFGYKKGELLKIGDLITNPDGSIQKIIQIKDRETLQLAKVKFSDGTYTDVAPGHLWLAWKSTKTRKINNKRTSGFQSAEVVETEEIKKWITKGYKPQIPVCSEVPFNIVSKEKDILDPYLLGLLLGDGCITKSNNISITAHDDDIPHYLSKIGNYGLSIGKQSIVFNGNRKKHIVKKLENYKLLGTYSNTKFIPYRFKVSSIKSRYELIRGLMDSDGYMPKGKYSAYYYSTSKILAEDVAFILRSLGSVVTITTKQGKYKKDNKIILCKTCYCLHIKHKEPSKLFSLDRKKISFIDRNISRSIISIEYPNELITGRCITVSNPNGLYITNDFIVTHNSYIIRWALIRQLIKWATEGHLNVRAGLFCENYPSLKDRQITKMKVEFPAWLGTLSDNSVEGMSFVLRKDFGGGIIALRNLDDPSKYASSEFAMVAIDELTKNPKEVFDQIRSIMRWPNIENTKFIAGTNPGELGHEWVKKLFIDRVFGVEDPLPEQVDFVKSLPTDNPHNAKSYIEELSRLPEKLRKAYMEGNWDVFEGQYFSEWDKDKHVVEPFVIPENWVRLRSIDPSGRAGTTSCHWYAVSSEGNVFVYREYFAANKDIDEHAKAIKEMSEGEVYPYTCIDTAAFNKLGLPETTAEIFERHGVDGLVPSMKNRIMGWNVVHQYLRWDEQHEPKLKIFNNCINLIRTIPLAIHDEARPEDIKSFYTGAEHQDALDDLRYLLQTLRDQSSPDEKTFVERRLERLNNGKDFDYSYARS